MQTASLPYSFLSVTLLHSGELLYGGPPHWLQRTLGLIKPGDPMIARRAMLVVLVGWVPLVALVVTQSFVLRNQMAKAFFSDFAVYQHSWPERSRLSGARTSGVLERPF